MQKVLFICTHNSARSQMAEGLLSHYAKGKHQAFSAGTHTTKVNPLAIQAMKEIGIDITQQFSKNLQYFQKQEFDKVITVCDSAKEACPNFPAETKKLHWGFKDPSQATGTYEEQLAFFRKTRDDILKKIQKEFNV